MSEGVEPRASRHRDVGPREHLVESQAGQRIRRGQAGEQDGIQAVAQGIGLNGIDRLGLPPTDRAVAEAGGQAAGRRVCPRRAGRCSPTMGCSPRAPAGARPWCRRRRRPPRGRGPGPRRWPWARLVGRVFAIEGLGLCGLRGPRRMLGAVGERHAVRRLLGGLGPGRRAAAGATGLGRLTSTRSRPLPGAAVTVCPPSLQGGFRPHLADCPSRPCPGAPPALHSAPPARRAGGERRMPVGKRDTRRTMLPTTQGPAEIWWERH